MYKRRCVKRSATQRIGSHRRRRKIFIEQLEDRRLLATFSVVTTADGVDGSLRQAILDANASPNADVNTPDVITFAIEGAGPHTIQPLSPLPGITDAVVIDGYSQPGSQVNTNPVGQGLNTVLMIELDGTSAGGDGLVVTAGNSTIRGLAINRFATNGIQIADGDGNVVEGNFIGTNLSGDAGLGNGDSGVLVVRSSGNLIGGTTAETRNLISGNSLGQTFGDRNGVSIGQGGGNNMVQGNLIGTDVSGGSTIGNRQNGVFVSRSDGNVIGGTVLGARNIISGNSENGIEIGNRSSGGNQILGNFIGTDVSGTTALANGQNGVEVRFENATNTIGGSNIEARNVISANALRGVLLSESSGIVVLGNYIGVNASGTVALGNGTGGITIDGSSSNNTIGGASIGAGNVIAGNDGPGILLLQDEVDSNALQGNFIGTDIGGTVNLGNGGPGVLINDASLNTIVENTIAFNGTLTPSTGVAILSGSDNAIRRNSMYQNAGLGIDLGGDGVSPNDLGDPDTGPNQFQNFPEIGSALDDGTNLSLTYEVTSVAPNSTFPLTVEFFLADADGQEGKTFLGADNFGETDGSKAISIAIDVNAGDLVVGTATDADGNTSEFSPSVTVSATTTEFDFGDAPDFVDSNQQYPTLLANDGARHGLTEIIPHIGPRGPDFEFDGQPDALAQGDDDDGVDDEDGLEQGSTVLVPGDDYRLFIREGNAGTLNAWMDYNRDGDWEDAGEQIITNLAMGGRGFVQTVDIDVPREAVSGPTVARFRISTQADLGPTGIAIDGEVEDHRFLISGLDYGDAQDSYGTTYDSDGARHATIRGEGDGLLPFALGSLVDAEFDGVPSTLANSDDTTDVNDADGIGGLDVPLMPGMMHPITVNATIPADVREAWLSGWIDFNGDGDFRDSGELVLDEFLELPFAGPLNFNIDVPAAAVVGQTYARFRLTSESGINFDGLAKDGEVEDYLVTIGEVAQFEISGSKYEDVNGNGIVDAGDVAQPGWTIFLDGFAGGTPDGMLDAGEPSVITDEAGAYTFSDVAAGTYAVTEVVQPGWVATADVQQTVTVVDADATGVDFLNTVPGSIHGIKFNDADQNGVRDNVAAVIEFDWTTVTSVDTENFVLFPNLGGLTTVNTHLNGVAGPVPRIQGLAPIEDFINDPGDITFRMNAVAVPFPAAPALELEPTTFDDGFNTGTASHTYVPMTGNNNQLEILRNGVVEAIGDMQFVTIQTVVNEIAPGNFELISTGFGEFMLTGVPTGADSTIYDTLVDRAGGTTIKYTLTEFSFLGTELGLEDGTINRASGGLSDLEGEQETGIAGVEFTLTGTDGLGNPISLRTSTDDQGEFSFENLIPTESEDGYTVSEVLTGGSTPTTPTSFATTLLSRQALVAVAGQAAATSPKTEVVIGAPLMFGNVVEQACSLVVTTTNDAVDNGDEQTSLREAILCGKRHCRLEHDHVQHPGRGRPNDQRRQHGTGRTSRHHRPGDHRWLHATGCRSERGSDRLQRHTAD